MTTDCMSGGNAFAAIQPLLCVFAGSPISSEYGLELRVQAALVLGASEIRRFRPKEE